MSKLAQMLESRPHLLADGATGTNLIPMGLDSGQAPELWNEDHPERITKLHKMFLDSGSDIILTNTFGGTSRRLKLHQADDRVADLNERAANIAGEAIAKSGRDVLLAGSVGPTGDLFVPLGELTYEGAVEAFIEQMEGLKSGGVDMAWIETMSAIEEVNAAIEAANAVGLDYAVTTSFDTAGKTMMGLAPATLGDEMNALDKVPAAIGSNCGVGASDLLVALLELTETAKDIPIIAKANAGIPRVSGDKVIYTGTSSLMGNYATLAANMGVQIIGGCCGTAPEHLVAMREAIDTHVAGEKPTAEEIIAELGDLVSPPNRSGGKKRERTGRRRRPAQE